MAWKRGARRPGPTWWSTGTPTSQATSAITTSTPAPGREPTTPLCESATMAAPPSGNGCLATGPRYFPTRCDDAAGTGTVQGVLHPGSSHLLRCRLQLPGRVFAAIRQGTGREHRPGREADLPGRGAAVDRGKWLRVSVDRWASSLPSRN